MILSRKFYQQNTLKVAQELLGCFLVRKIGNKIIRGMITETEAYIGEDDLACHASKGRTPRTEIMYGEAGHAYVYMIYGMYHCLNIVTEKKDFPAAVLIRGIKLPEGSTFGRRLSLRRLDGPGKLCKFLKIDRKLNNRDITKGGKLWIEKPSFAKATAHEVKIKKSDICKDKRIGVDYAQHCKHYQWRFYIKPEK